MIEALADVIDSFPGTSNRTQCFAHIVNLVAKTIIHQFANVENQGETLTAAQEELARLVDGIEYEKMIAQAERESKDDEDDGDGRDDNDNEDGWVNEWDGLSPEDLQDLEDTVQPVRQVLVKVSSLFNGEIHTFAHEIVAVQWCTP
jgi:hypothetical protein